MSNALEYRPAKRWIIVTPVRGSAGFFKRFYRRDVVGRIAGAGIGLSSTKLTLKQNDRMIALEHHDGEGELATGQRPFVTAHHGRPRSWHMVCDL